MLGHEANRKRCPHGFVTGSHGMTLYTLRSLGQLSQDHLL